MSDSENDSAEVAVGVSETNTDVKTFEDLVIKLPNAK